MFFACSLSCFSVVKFGGKLLKAFCCNMSQACSIGFKSRGCAGSPKHENRGLVERPTQAAA